MAAVFDLVNLNHDSHICLFPPFKYPLQIINTFK